MDRYLDKAITGYLLSIRNIQRIHDTQIQRPAHECLILPFLVCPEHLLLIQLLHLVPLYLFIQLIQQLHLVLSGHHQVESPLELTVLEILGNTLHVEDRDTVALDHADVGLEGDVGDDGTGEGLGTGLGVNDLDGA